MSYSLGLTAAQADRDMGWTAKKLKSYWDERAKACEQFADEGECLAQVARHVPVTIGGYSGLGAFMARGAPRRRPAGSAGARGGRPVGVKKRLRRARKAARRAARAQGKRGRAARYATSRYPSSGGGGGGGVRLSEGGPRRREVGTSGLGAASASTIIRTTADLITDPEGVLARRGPALVRAADRHVIVPMVDKVAVAMAPYMMKYILPPIAVLYIISGIGAFYSYKTAKKLSANKRRRRRTSRR